MDNPIERMFRDCTMAELVDNTQLCWNTLDSIRHGRHNPQTRQLPTIKKLGDFLECPHDEIRQHLRDYNKQRAAKKDSDVA